MKLPKKSASTNQTKMVKVPLEIHRLLGRIANQKSPETAGKETRAAAKLGA